MRIPAQLFSLTVAAALVGCSSLIPPQKVPNTLGLAGQQVGVEIGATGAGVSSATATGLGIVKTSFPDVDTSSVPISVSLSQTLFKIGFVADTRLSTSAAPLPCTIILTKLDIKVTLSDAQRSLTLPTFSVNKVVELEQQAADPNTYRIVNADVFVGNVLSGEEVRRLQEVITTGGINRAEVHLSVQATSVPDLPPGSVLTFTFGTSEATLAF